MSEIATRQDTALAIQPNQTEFNEAQIATLAQLGVGGADRANLAVFFHQSVRTGLDPFAKQIYMIGRNSKEMVWDPNAGRKVERYVTKYTIQTGIDGYRLIARRGADKAKVSLSVDDTLWCGIDGVWTDVWTAQEPPIAAKVTVWRGNEHYSAVALWREYVQTYYHRDSGQHVPNSMWQKMPTNQLAKCAEAAALRKAFPLDLSGIYTDDEMPDESPAPEIVDEGEVTIPGRIRTQSQPTEPETVPEDAPEAEPTQEDVLWGKAEETTPEEPPTEAEGPQDDPQDDEGPAVLEDYPEPRPEPEVTPTDPSAPDPTDTQPATRAQRTKVSFKLTEMGVKTKDQAAQLLTKFAGRNILSTADLTTVEAAQFLEQS